MPLERVGAAGDRCPRAPVIAAENQPIRRPTYDPPAPRAIRTTANIVSAFRHLAALWRKLWRRRWPRLQG